MEKPQKKSANLTVQERSPIFWSKCLSAGGAGPLPVEAVPEACNKQEATIAIFLFKFLSSREAGTLLAEPVPDASKIQGSTIAIFHFAFLLFLVEFLLNRPQRNASQLFSRG